MIIDEDRRYVLESVGKYSIKESDHNTMVLDFNFKQKDVSAKIRKRNEGTGSYQVTPLRILIDQ